MASPSTRKPQKQRQQRRVRLPSLVSSQTILFALIVAMLALCACHQHFLVSVASAGESPDGNSRGSGGSAAAGPRPQQPQNPVIALVVNPMPECTNNGKKGGKVPPVGYEATGCVTDLYLRWLQAQGIRVVPMNVFWPREKQKRLLDRVNGVLLPGGGLAGIDREKYTIAASYIYEYALAHPGFLLWGTCQGMQVMTILAFENDFSVLECDYKGMIPSMLPLEFTQYQPRSVLFSHQADRLGMVEVAENTKSTMNWHECGIQPYHFHPNTDPVRNGTGHERNSRVKVVSTNTDVTGKPFVSSFEVVDEGRNIFAVQFHPERPQYQFTHDIITHERGTIELSLYFARFIYERLQMNNHTFESQEEVNELLLENFPHAVTGWGLGHYWVDI